MVNHVDLRPVTDIASPHIHLLAAEARREGYRFLDRLIDEWSHGSNRFERDGECLLMAYAGDVPLGIGGVTHEPAIAGALRMRRFYIHQSARHRGIGRMLARALIDQARPGTSLFTVHAGTEAASAFWETLGFLPDHRDGYSHVLRFD